MALHTLYTLEAPVFDTYRAQSHPYVKMGHPYVNLISKY